MNTNQTNKPSTPNTNNTNISPTTQIPPPLPSKTKKPWLLISIVVLLLSATGILGYKYYQVKQQLDKQQANSARLPSLPLVDSSPSPTTNSIINWETYSEENYSFQYPKGLVPIKYSPPLDTGVHFFFSEQEAKVAFDCFANKKGTLESPCGFNGVFDIYFIQLDPSNERSFINKYNSYPENPIIYEYIDKKGRKWIIKGPVWGEGSSSVAVAQFIEDGILYSFSSQINGETYGQFVNKKLIIGDQKNGFNAEPLIKAHEDLFEYFLSSLEF